MTLTFYLLTLKLVLFMALRVVNIGINFGVSVTYHSRIMGAC